ncbi:methyl-accepting chemotaxis protein [Alkalihalophilus lindianensis]|uniref:Methyl-accepting chemotaxis protein n=1 Tax=Alkalihalophilus lindianensis TaxID=1630542 RepID=A0ABU3XD02_9BACI|nr:methyl-accepting chemotaxis protein [Alkalihalophilus lindianensis]MDV2685759.1 methyl-accepting chemotaxis protein [Alkalihalophilus lindianensis]
MNARKTDEEILEAIVTAAPYIQEAAKEEIAISICDHDKWLLQLDHPNLVLGNKTGDPVSNDDPVIQSALNGKGGMGRPPFEVYGMHFFGKTTPIMNEGRVIGAIGMAYNIEVLMKMEKNVEKLNEITASIQQLIEQIISQASQLQTTNQQLYDLSEKSKENSEEVNHILELMNKISRQTNILGLNANIEAARAGEAGKGFSVVANEVRTISKETAESSDKINQSITVIKDNLGQMIKSLSTIRGLTTEQTTLVKNVAETLDTLATIIHQLHDYMKTLG